MKRMFRPPEQYQPYRYYYCCKTKNSAHLDAVCGRQAAVCVHGAVPCAREVIMCARARRCDGSSLL